jgi:hypothetical protein
MPLQRQYVPGRVRSREFSHDCSRDCSRALPRVSGRSCEDDDDDDDDGQDRMMMDVSRSRRVGGAGSASERSFLCVMS